MANTQSMTTSFLEEVLTATHNFGTAPVRASGAADTFKAALYLASATVNAASTVYTTSGEVTGVGYTAGGVAVTNGGERLITNNRSSKRNGARARAGCGFFYPIF